MALADLGLNPRTKPYTWTFADATARNAAGSYTSDDIGSFGLQLDTGELYRLTATTPTWQALATGLSNPMTTAGDLIVGDTGGAAIRLALAGTNGHVLQRAAGAIAWGAVPSHTHAAADVASGTLATARLGSGTADATTFLRGDQTWATPAGGGGGGYSGYVVIKDEKTAGTGGGTFTSGAWRVRDLNTEHADTGNHASVASNQITLAAGWYQCLILCPVYRVDRHQARLYDVTNAAEVLTGSSEFASVGGDNASPSFIQGRFQLLAGTTLEVQHRCATTSATLGFGVESNSGGTVTRETYTVATFWRE